METNLEIPSSSYQFERDWKIASNDSLTTYKYLKVCFHYLHFIVD